MYKTKSAVLFLVFNRVDTTLAVFNAIKNTKPPKLYIASDGARSNIDHEANIVLQIREFLISNIDWECEVYTLFREENLGCKNAVSSAIQWFFKNEEEGIVLEDDCLPNTSFFKYCDTLLDKYRFDDRIRHIGGTNVRLKENIGDGSYYFSNFTHIWGWASWRRVWKDYDVEIKKFPKFYEENLMKEIYTNFWAANHCNDNFEKVAKGTINTWDYQYLFLNFINNGLSIFPNVNLISNIGFGAGATHTVNDHHKYANLQVFDLDEIRHPSYFIPMKSLDQQFMLDEMDLNILKKSKYLVKMLLKKIGLKFYK